jgi:hypothetical protein
VGTSQSEFRLRLAVTASDEADETLGVIVYGALSARSEFQAAVTGDVSGPAYVPDAVPLDDLRSDPAGGVDLVIPVNQPGSSTEYATGVYPVQAFLEKGDVRVGDPLTTFLVYAGADATHLDQLNASLVVPMVAAVPIDPRTGLPGSLTGPAAGALRADSAVLGRHRACPDLEDNAPCAQVTVQADVPTLEALASGGTVDKLAVEELAAAVGSGDELLPSTSLPVDLSALVASRLTTDLQTELSSGSAALGTLLGVSPTLLTWAFNDGIDPTSIAALTALGAQQVVVPESDLSEVPSEYQGLTFGWPTKLRVAGAQLEVMGADTELSARVSQASQPGQAVLVANQVLAELAMVDLERPSQVRGVVLLPPSGTMIDPAFLSVFLAGLQGDPLVRATTLAGEFQSVPLEIPPANKTLVRYLRGPAQGQPLAGAGRLPQAISALSAEGEVYGDGTAFVAALEHQLIISAASAWNASQRSAMIAGIVSAARSQLSKVRLPPSISITLTSHQGRLPLTILSASGVPAHIRLLLSSEELSFVAQRFSQGSCLPVSPSSERCQLTLTKTTTFQVPVAVRTSGVFQLSLALETPSGDLQMEASTDTVRSTATNQVALGLMIGAALFLLVWWARNVRHGRRARKLVPRPFDDEPSEGAVVSIERMAPTSHLLGPAGGPPA